MECGVHFWCAGAGLLRAQFGVGPVNAAHLRLRRLPVGEQFDLRADQCPVLVRHGPEGVAHASVQRILSLPPFGRHEWRIDVGLRRKYAQ